MGTDGLQAVAGADARVLILGTLPGKVSLECRQYYAQPRNVFWRIMERTIGVNIDMPYEHRTRQLVENGIALWDVCAAGHRSGSLDSTIRLSTVVPNDFCAFFGDHKYIALICFNGRKAATIYERKILRTLPEPFQKIPCKLLPSTSPANASVTFEDKMLCWGAALHATFLRTKG